MVQVNVREAKDNFSRLLAMVEAGEEVVIARNGVPVAMLVAVEGEVREAGTRQPGRWKGVFKLDDSFFDPLPEEELARWEG